jgi:chromosome segregation ATPase
MTSNSNSGGAGGGEGHTRTSSRGWLEGTLDVIGNKVMMSSTRSSTPPLIRRNNPTPTPTTPTRPQLLQRLPSQDSLDRSIHNDSSHGVTGSKEEQIQFLKQANAKLTAQTAQLEADFMNQLQQEQSVWLNERVQLQQQIETTQQELNATKLQISTQERRMADKDAVVLRLRDEAAYHRQHVSELQLQFKQQQQQADEQQRTTTTSTTSTAENKSSSSSSPEAKDNEGASDEGSRSSSTAAAKATSNTGTLWRQLEASQGKLQAAEQALAKQQADSKLQQQHAEKRIAVLQQELQTLKTTAPSGSATATADDNNRNSKNNDDDTIIMELRQKVLDYSSQLTAMTAELAQTKQSSNSETATQEDTQELRRQLEDAVQEMELREQELQTVTQQLQDAQQANGALQLELEKTRGETAKCVADLQVRIDELLERQPQPQHGSKSTPPPTTAGGESTQDLARVADLQAELQMLRSISQSATSKQSGGALEEDLRKQLQSMQLQKDRLESEMLSLQQEYQEELEELRGKLEDRDTTISALVKSSVAFEEQIESERAQNALLQIQHRQREIMLMNGNTSGEGVDIILSPANSLLGDELAELRETIAEYREKEEKSRNKMARLDMKLRLAKQETADLRARFGLPEIGGVEEQKVNDEDESVTESTANTSFAYTPGQQIKDRDDAIANILKQLMAKERQVKELQEQLDATKERQQQQESTNSKVIAPSWDEVNQLREEAEVFASQIIELDEEIDTLKATVELRETRIGQLEQELKEAKGFAETRIGQLEQGLKEAKDLGKSVPVDPKKIMNLEAEIDELQEANTTLQDEIRLLRRKAREFETYSDDIEKVQQELRKSRNQMDDLKKNADTAEGEVEKLTQLLEENRKAHANELSRETARFDAIIREKEAALEALEAEKKVNVEGPDDEGSHGDTAEMSALRAEADTLRNKTESLQAEIDTLRTKLTTQSNAVESAKSTIRELENILAEKRSTEAADHEHEKEELLSEIDSLTTKLEEARAELNKVENERGLIDDFKQKLESADESREASEKLIVDTYERKLKLLTTDKDATIDKLRRELVAEKEDSDMQLEEAATQIQMLENQIEEMKEEMTAELTQRETKIFALETTLQAQEQLVNNMRVEMDHLQGSMETTAKDRKKEIEDLQQECVDLTTANGKQEREIKALQSELEEKAIKHKSEVEDLQKRIAVLEEETANESEHRNAADLKMELRVQEVRDRLEKLKWANTSLKEDNELLRERLGKAEEVAHVKLAGQDELNELKFGIRKRNDRIKELELELETLKLSPIIVGPSHPVTPIAVERKAAKSTPRTQASPRRQRSIGGLLGRRHGRTQSQDGVAELPPKP